MVTTKLVCLLILAVGASQVQAVPHQSKSLIDVALQVIQILHIVNEKLSSGIEQARPIIESLEAELNPELAADVHKLFTDLETTLNKIVKRILYLEQEVQAAIDQLKKNIPDCVTSSDSDLQPYLDVAEKEIADLVNELLNKNNASITSIVDQVKLLITNLDTANDKAIAGGLACVTPGKTDTRVCLDENTTTWKESLLSVLTSAVLVLNEALPLVQDIIAEGYPQLQAIGLKFDTESEPVWAKFGTCVENTKP